MTLLHCCYAIHFIVYLGAKCQASFQKASAFARSCRTRSLRSVDDCPDFPEPTLPDVLIVYVPFGHTFCQIHEAKYILFRPFADALSSTSTIFHSGQLPLSY